MEELVFGGRLVASNASELPFSSLLRLIQLEDTEEHLNHKTMCISDSYLSRFMDTINRKSFALVCFFITTHELSLAASKTTGNISKKRKAADMTPCIHEEYYNDDDDVQHFDSEIYYAIYKDVFDDGRKT